MDRFASLDHPKHLLDFRRQVNQVHDLCDPRMADVPPRRRFRLVGNDEIVLNGTPILQNCCKRATLATS